VCAHERERERETETESERERERDRERTSTTCSDVKKKHTITCLHATPMNRALATACLTFAMLAGAGSLPANAVSGVLLA
jgi:hypothetical protein